MKARPNPLTSVEFVIGTSLALVSAGIGWFLLYQQTQATNALTKAIQDATVPMPGDANANLTSSGGTGS